MRICGYADMQMRKYAKNVKAPNNFAFHPLIHIIDALWDKGVINDQTIEQWGAEHIMLSD